MLLRQEQIKIYDGFEIPITLEGTSHLSPKNEEIENYSIYIDGVHWVTVSNRVHVVVLFELMKDHITEYMHYEKRKNS